MKRTAKQTTVETTIPSSIDGYEVTKTLCPVYSVGAQSWKGKAKKGENIEFAFVACINGVAMPFNIYADGQPVTGDIGAVNETFYLASRSVYDRYTGEASKVENALVLVQGENIALLKLRKFPVKGDALLKLFDGELPTVFKTAPVKQSKSTNNVSFGLKIAASTAKK